MTSANLNTNIPLINENDKLRIVEALLFASSDPLIKKL